MSKHVTLAFAATALIALSGPAFSQGHGHGHGRSSGSGPPPGRGLVTQGGGGGGGFVAPNASTGGRGAYVQGGSNYTPRPDHRHDSRRYHHRSGGWWGPAIGFGIGVGYPYWGYGGYGYGWDDYYYPSYGYGYADLGNFCATRVRTCQLYEPAPVGARCSCRVPGGRAVGQVVP